MAQHTIVEDHVIDNVRRTRVCDLEDVTRHCTNLTWNQMFLAVDGLRRSGELMLVSRGRGRDTGIFRQLLDGRPYPHSISS
jgi:hypothetical protein